MKRIFKYVIFFVLAVFFYSYGVLSLKYNLEPYNTVRQLKTDLVDIKVDHSDFYETVVDGEIEYVGDLLRDMKPSIERESLLQKLILPKPVVAVTSKKIRSKNCLIDPIAFETEFYGIKQRGYLEKFNNKRLLIYFQGHGGSPCEYDYFQRLKKKVSDEFDILSFSMFGKGNNGMDSISFPIHINNRDASNLYFNNNFKSLNGGHHVVQFFHDKNYPDRQPLSLFLSSSYHIIDELIDQYDEVVITGISGGSWYATLLAGLIPQIDRLYSFNGTLPLVYKINNLGDYEQHFAEVWDSNDYYTFYLLSLFDTKDEMTRTSFHLYSEFDECCFTSPEIYFFDRTVKRLDIPNLKTLIFKDRTEHAIEVEWLSEQLLGRAR